jgi:hypothetical protein
MTSVSQSPFLSEKFVHMQDVPAMEACRDLCLSAPYRCHSFDYGDTGIKTFHILIRICWLFYPFNISLDQPNKIREPLVLGNFS